MKKSAKRRAIAMGLSAALWLLAVLMPGLQAADERRVVDVVSVSDAITPPISEYILKSIRQAAESGAQAIVIQLDTPGGLDLSMRDIIKECLNAPVPVVVYVSPSGARAASAGVLITISAHVAAMAPGTNIGAAHPVAMGIGKADETMMEKVENDAVAYGRGIADQRGRNADWIEEAIRKSVSVTAEEALRLKVIDLVAEDLERLLEKIDGREVKLASGPRVLKTKGAEINRREMGFREKVLITISNPNIAFILFLLGLAGLYFEFSSPGVILPGIIGGISLILAFFAFQTLPVNYAGILLILFAVILFIAEIKVVSHGVLTIGGVVSLVLGSIMLFESPDPALRVSWSVLVPAVSIVSLFFVAVISIAVRAQMRKVMTSREGLIGARGEALSDVHERGKVLIGGEYWNAFSREPIAKGKKVEVVAVDGLNVEVRENR
ncbi:MAG TPA: nodulation protein NfeD [Syntrophales bacterium]|nr:nodulation protein NfeD [Syntrophobacterales bacterium]HQL90830.1 nodulation protein NfeD [Syntrophales bacterium]